MEHVANKQAELIGNVSELLPFETSIYVFMKVLLIIFAVVLIHSSSININAQSCGYALIHIGLINAENQTIRAAKIELFDKRHSENEHLKSDFTKLNWLDDKEEYLLAHGMCGKHFRVGLKISATGFKAFERQIDLTFGEQLFEVQLKRIDSNEAERFQILKVDTPMRKIIE